MQTVSILGTEYTFSVLNEAQDKTLENCDGYTDYTVKKIIIRDNAEDANDITSVLDLKYLMNKTIRHEIIHAFLCESGLIRNSTRSDHWSINEEMVDWIAIQFPKIHKVYTELGVL